MKREKAEYIAEEIQQWLLEEYNIADVDEADLADTVEYCLEEWEES